MEKAGAHTYRDKKYIYVWDGMHDGGEWEVYARSSGKHIGVIDPLTGGWHATKGAEDGRRYKGFMVFPMVIRPGGALILGPVLADIDHSVVERVASRVGERPVYLDRVESLVVEQELVRMGFYVPSSLPLRYLAANEVTRDGLAEAVVEILEAYRSFGR